MHGRASAGRGAARRAFSERLLVLFALLSLGWGSWGSSPAGAQLEEEDEGPPAALGKYVDVVILDGGDSLRGEIKGLDRGKLRFKTRATDTIQVTWDLVASLESPKPLAVEDVDGEFYFGALLPTENPGILRVATEAWVKDLPMEQVVTIRPIKASFWSRLDGSLALGLSVVTASSTNQISAHADATENRRRSRTRLSFDHISNRGDPTNPVSRQDLTGSWERKLKNRWGVQGGGTAQANEELDLQSRLLGSGIGVHQFIQSSHRLLSLGGGLAVTREQYFGSDPSIQVEGVVQFDYEAFSFVTRDLDVSNRLVIYPSFTVSGRVRLELNLRGRRELYKDLYWDMNLNYSYDSDPQAQSSPGEEGSTSPRKDDLSLTLSLAWAF